MHYVTPVLLETCEITEVQITWLAGGHIISDKSKTIRRIPAQNSFSLLLLP